MSSLGVSRIDKEGGALSPLFIKPESQCSYADVVVLITTDKEPKLHSEILLVKCSSGTAAKV